MTKRKATAPEGPMDARQANRKAASVRATRAAMDNTEWILRQVASTAADGRNSVEVAMHLLTPATRKKLEELGYKVAAESWWEKRPIQWGEPWDRGATQTTFYRVSW